MARHRNVRSMNYSDEYDGYDDVYGHSVEDDFCVSPSDAAFMYNREGSKNQHIGAFIKDISEEDEQELQLSENDQPKLESCIAQLKLVLGDSVSRKEMTTVLCDNNLNVDKTLNILLDNISLQPKEIEKKDKDDNVFQMTTKYFNVPKLQSFKLRKNVDAILTENTSSSQLNLPKLNSQANSKMFGSLNDLSNNHLKNIQRIQFSNLKSNKLINMSERLSDIKLLDTEEAECLDVPFGNTNRKINSLNQRKNIYNNSEQNIDLTKALTKDMWHKSIVGNNKKFDYLDVTCEKTCSDCNCTMDISSVLYTSPNISKKVSTFGKILCCSYKNYLPLINNDKQFSTFSLNVPSPDDVILSYLKI